MKNITIIGSGALGSAFANVLFDANPKNNILIYGIDEKELQDIEKGRNTKYFNEGSYDNLIKCFSKSCRLYSFSITVNCNWFNY